MPEQPKNLENNSGLENIEKIGGRFLSEEIDRLPDSKRTGGFLLTTFIATGLAFAGAGSAEAQVRTGRFLMGGPTSGITGEIFQQGRMGAGQVMERKKMETRAKINIEYQKKIREIDVKKSQLTQKFKNERISIGEYEAGMHQFDNEIYRLSQERDKKLANPLGVKGRILEGIIRGY